MTRNITILYILACLGNAWVWLAIWAFFYLLHTDYRGIGIIEMFTFVTATVMEIPSGALADKYGKVKILTIGYFLGGVGNVIIALSENLLSITIGAVVIMMGIAFLSGAYQAVTYDSLSQMGQGDEYEKVYSRQKTIHMITFAFAALVGGYLYTRWFPGAPFLITGLFYFCACVLSFSLREPECEAKQEEKLGFLQQNLIGFSCLFKNMNLKPYIIVFFAVGVIPVFMYEAVAEYLVIERGITPELNGWALPFLFICSGLAAYITPYITKRINKIVWYAIMTVVYLALIFISPLVGLYAVIIVRALWASISSSRDIIESEIINKHTLSTNRATTLSTFAMIRYIPYALTAALIGLYLDLVNITSLVYLLGSIMCFLSIISFVYFVTHKKNS